MTEVKNIPEVKHFQQILGNWGMVPLSTQFNNNDKAMLIKYNQPNHYEIFRQNPFVHQKYYWIVAHKNGIEIPTCLFIVKVSDQYEENHSTHELFFNLADNRQSEDLKSFANSTNQLFILSSNDDALVVTLKKNSHLSTQVNTIVNELCNVCKTDTSLYNEIQEKIYSLGDTNDIMNYLDKLVEESGSSIFHINL